MDPKIARMAGMWLVARTCRRKPNRITLDPKAKDKFGMPVASVHFDAHPTTSRCAITPTSRAPPSTRPFGATRDLSDAALPEHA